MIIVSQEKNIILNLENIIGIQMEDNCIGAYLVNDDSLYIGEYKTKERAKEVLQEIITRYKDWENLKAGQPTGLCVPVYEMPKK